VLILRRKVGEKIVIGDGITVVVNRVSGGRVTLGIDAPPDVHIVRGELRAFDEAPPQPVVTLVTSAATDLHHVTTASGTSPLPR
jgi:carbon storage regulator